MAVQIFIGNVIAVIWDFDQTMIPGYQQDPLFHEYNIDPTSFWSEVNGLAEKYEPSGILVSKEIAYLNHLLTYAEAGLLPGLTNQKLRHLGAELAFYEGLPEFLEQSKKDIENDEEFAGHGITVEHYVVSTGLRQMILGSKVAPFLKEVWASEFVEAPQKPGYLSKAEEEEPSTDAIVRQIGYFLDNTTKTRAIWEINKGVNVEDHIEVNSFIPPEDRRVPLRNMIYIADGPSDIPVFSILNQYGGHTLGVYNPASEKHFEALAALNDQGRFNAMAEARYTPDSLAAKWIMSTLRKIGRLIVRDRDRALSDRVLPPGGHVLD